MMEFGASDRFDALLYGESHPGTVEYLRNEVERASMSDILTDTGRAFMKGAAETFEYFNGSRAMDFARSVVGKAKGLFQQNYIIPLTTVAELRDATVTMQRWIMAHPETRKRFNDQRIDGFADTYVDMDPGAWGETHYDYRRVTEGLLVTDDKGDRFVEYIEPLREGDRRLTMSEQLSIKEATWDYLDLVYAIGEEDPTNPTGGKL